MLSRRGFFLWVKTQSLSDLLSSSSFTLSAAVRGWTEVLKSVVWKTWRTISMGVPLCGAHIWPQLCPGSRTWGVFKELNGFYIPTKLGIHRDHLSSSSGGLTNFNQRFKVHSDGCGINPRPRPFRWGWLKNPVFVVNSNGPTVSPNGQGCTVR